MPASRSADAYPPAPAPPRPAGKRTDKTVALLVVLAVIVGAVLTAGTFLAWNLLNGPGDARANPAPESSRPSAPAQSVAPTLQASPDSAAPSASADSTTPSARPTAPAGAFPGAGGGIPLSATPITAVHALGGAEGFAEVATIESPSGNIGCEFVMDDFGEVTAGCGVASYADTGQYGQDEGGRKWWIDITGIDVPEVYSRGDVAYYMMPDAPPQVVAYGEVVTYGDFVCGSLESGLTCWNTSTGHGAFMNRRGFEAF